MIQIGKAESIPLTYQLADGAAAPTRYVRAVLIKSSDRSTLATVNLTDNGDGDFSNFSKTPAILSLNKLEYFEAIMTVYKDSGYTNVDNLRYATTKQVFIVKETAGGILFGGGTGSGQSLDLGRLADEIVKRIFRFDGWKEIKNPKSFAQLFMGLVQSKTGDEIKTAIAGLEKLIDDKHEAITKTIEQLAELIAEEGKAIIRDLSEAIANVGKSDGPGELGAKMDRFGSKLDTFEDNLKALKEEIAGINHKQVDVSSLKEAIQGLEKSLGQVKELEMDEAIERRFADIEQTCEEILSAVTK